MSLIRRLLGVPDPIADALAARQGRRAADEDEMLTRARVESSEAERRLELLEHRLAIKQRRGAAR